MSESQSEFFSKPDFAFSDSFTLVRKIYSSESGHTEMYEAHKSLKRFAVKALKPEFRDSALYLGLLRKEFEIGFHLDHPGIARVYSFETIDELGPCIVTEWVDGITLGEAVERKRFGDEEWLRIAGEICDCLAYLEARQVVHRDLKPSNIMLTADGGHVKLIDFGFSDSPEYSVLKHSGGTKGYAAPEQIVDSEAGARSDIYSLGRILQELPLEKPKKLRRLAGGMVAANPSSRPASASEVKREIVRMSARRRNRKIILWGIILAGIGITAGGILLFRAVRDASTIETPVEMISEQQDSTVHVVENTESPTEKVESAVIPASQRSSERPSVEEGSVIRGLEEVSDSDSSSPKRFMHWMVLLAAQQTRGTARRLREAGDKQWEADTRQEIGDWVDTQTADDPNLREECHNIIDETLLKLKKENP